MTPSLSHDIHVNRMTSQTVLQGPPVALRLLRRFILCLPRGRHLVIRSGAPRFVRQPPFKGRFDSDRQFFVADLGEHIARSLFFYGFYEQVETSALLHVIRPGQTIIDVGANFGYFTLLSAPRVGGSGRVIAFEPEPANAALLRENVALNAHTNITVEEMAVGRAAARVRFRTARPGEWNRGKTATVPAENVGNDGVINVPCVGLDAYCDEHGIRRVDILKMDIEGGEAEAVEGMRRGVQEGRYRRVFLEVHPAAATTTGARTSRHPRRFPRARLHGVATSQSGPRILATLLPSISRGTPHPVFGGRCRWTVASFPAPCARRLAHG